jgi:hypothetical protein
MQTTVWTEEQILLEQYAERAALSVVRGANFTQCLTINELAPSITVMTPTSRQVTIHGRDLFDERTWQKFLSTQGYPIEQSRLTGTIDSLVKEYRSWLKSKKCRERICEVVRQEFGGDLKTLGHFFYSSPSLTHPTRSIYGLIFAGIRYILEDKPVAVL